jgi:hypothetical protein
MNIVSSVKSFLDIIRRYLTAPLLRLQSDYKFINPNTCILLVNTQMMRALPLVLSNHQQKILVKE